MTYLSCTLPNKTFNNAYPFKARQLCIIQNVYKTIILWLNEKRMQHLECYTGRFKNWCLTKNFSLLHFCSSSCSQGHLAGQSKFIDGDYQSFINGGTTLYRNWIMRDRQYKFQYNSQNSGVIRFNKLMVDWRIAFIYFTSVHFCLSWDMQIARMSWSAHEVSSRAEFSIFSGYSVQISLL